MKAISLWQPWASLIADGRKKYETRHWPTNYRGPLAIHAAKRVEWEACQTFGYNVNTIPTGVILCTAELSGCLRMTGDLVDLLRRLDAGDEEYLMGNWSEGRYAWRLLNVVKLERPCPIPGRQGLFEWNR